MGPDEVERALPALASKPAVIMLEPHTLEEVFDSIQAVGDALGRPAEATALVGELRRRVNAVRARVALRGRRPRVAFLEWADPPISGGHWNPELVELAGGCDGSGLAGPVLSRTVSWEEILGWRPEVMVLACCGFDEARGREELELLRRLPGFAGLPCARSSRVHVMGTGCASSAGRARAWWTVWSGRPPCSATEAQSAAFAASSRHCFQLVVLLHRAALEEIQVQPSKRLVPVGHGAQRTPERELALQARRSASRAPPTAPARPALRSPTFLSRLTFSASHAPAFLNGFSLEPTRSITSSGML